MDQEYDVMFKIVLVGDAGVGKTNMLACFIRNSEKEKRIQNDSVSTFHETRKPTIGVEFGSKTIVHPDGTRIRAHIWDTAGQERYRAITKTHYRRAAGALIVYDVTSKKSFENAINVWLKDLKKVQEPKTALSCIMLVGNKVDLSEETVVPLYLHKQVCEEHNLIGMRTSAKTGENISDAFESLISSVHRHFQTIDEEEDYGKSIIIGNGVGGKQQDKCC